MSGSIATPPKGEEGTPGRIALLPDVEERNEEEEPEAGGGVRGERAVAAAAAAAAAKEEAQAAFPLSRP